MRELIERVARAMCTTAGFNPDGDWAGPIHEPAWKLYERNARTAVAEVAEYLDGMGTNSDEDSMAVDWISGLLRDAALADSDSKTAG